MYSRNPLSSLTNRPSRSLRLTCGGGDDDGKVVGLFLSFYPSTLCGFRQNNNNNKERRGGEKKKNRKKVVHDVGPTPVPHTNVYGDNALLLCVGYRTRLCE